MLDYWRVPEKSPAGAKHMRHGQGFPKMIEIPGTRVFANRD